MVASEDFLEAQRTIHRFFHCLDGREYGGLVALVADDGVWMRQGKELRGPAAVAEALRTRPADFTTIHVVSNLLLDGDEARLAGTFYATVFAHSGETPDGPIAIALPNVVAIYDVALRRGGTWLIERLASRRLFQRAA